MLKLSDGKEETDYDLSFWVSPGLEDNGYDVDGKDNEIEDEDDIDKESDEDDEKEEEDKD